MKLISVELSWNQFYTKFCNNCHQKETSTGIDAGASKGKSWPGYSWQQSGLMLKMWDTGFISTLCQWYLSMINWIMPNLHVVIAMRALDPGSGPVSPPGGCEQLYLRRIDQSHRYGRHQAACREPAGSYDKTTRTAMCFEHKTQYLLIRAPYARIMIFWHISNIPPMISQSQISCNTPTFYIAAIFVKYCYTTGSWLL